MEYNRQINYQDICIVFALSKKFRSKDMEINFYNV